MPKMCGGAEVSESILDEIKANVNASTVAPSVEFDADMFVVQIFVIENYLIKSFEINL